MHLWLWYMFVKLFFRSSPVHIFGNSNSLHSYARPPLASSAPTPSRGHLRERRRVRVISHFWNPNNHTILLTHWSFRSKIYMTCILILDYLFIFIFLQQASSESESGVFSMSSSFSDDEDMAWSHSWPSTAWHCFLKGTFTYTLTCWMHPPVHTQTTPWLKHIEVNPELLWEFLVMEKWFWELCVIA